MCREKCDLRSVKGKLSGSVSVKRKCDRSVNRTCIESKNVKCEEKYVIRTENGNKKCTEGRSVDKRKCEEKSVIEENYEV